MKKQWTCLCGLMVLCEICVIADDLAEKIEAAGERFEQQTRQTLEASKKKGWRDPPTANQWAGTQDTHLLILGTQTDIEQWTLVSSPAYPQPGFIVAHPNDQGPGHVGITDYDGEGIGAGTSGTVNKNFDFLGGDSNWRQYEP